MISKQLAPGLYLVATPIGNLGDITLRALDVLKHADRIACEDTRQTQKLLNHFEITTPTVSCHQHNERDRADRTDRSAQSRAPASPSSPTPACPASAIPAPGSSPKPSPPASPSSPSPAPTPPSARSSPPACPPNEFHFLGFLPEKAGARRTRLEDLAADSLANSAETLIFYEAPHRILDTLADLESVLGPDCA